MVKKKEPTYDEKRQKFNVELFDLCEAKEKPVVESVIHNVAIDYENF